MKQKLILLVLVIGLTIVSQTSFSLGMGKIQVYSALNEPLQSSIELITHAEEDLQNLEVKLASSEDYQKVGLDRSFVPSNINVALDEDNPYLIRVTSNGPVTEPIVSLLLDVNWSNGRILREFTILLDPPVYESSANVQVNNVVVEPIQDDVIEEPVETTADTQADTSSDSSPALQPRSDETTTYTNEDVLAQDDDISASEPVSDYVPGEITVAAGDTLWRIANNNKVGDLSTHQMMMAIYNSNPSAFLDNNINQLVKGSRLRMPTADEAASIGYSEALAQVESHHQSWAPAQQDYSAFQTEDDPVDVYEEPTSSLDYGVQLSGGDSDGSDAGQSNADEGSDADMQAIQEDLYNKDSENTELKERISELEDIVEQQQEAFDIQDDSLANLENQLGSDTDADPLTSDDATTDDGTEDDIWSTVDDTTDEADAMAANDDPFSLSVDEVSTDDGLGDAGLGDADNTDTTSDDVADADTTEPATTEPASPPKFGGDSGGSESMVDTAINWVMDNLRWVLIGLGGLIVLLILPKVLRRSDDGDDDTSFLDDIKNRNKEAEAADEDFAEDAVETKMNQPLMEDDAEMEAADEDGDDVLAELDKSIQFDEDDTEDLDDTEDEDDPFANAGEVAQEDSDDDGFDLDGFLNDDDDDYNSNTSVTADHSETMAGVNFDDEGDDDEATADDDTEAADDDGLDLDTEDDLFEDFDMDLDADESDDDAEDDDAETPDADDTEEAVMADDEDDFSFDEDFDFDLDDELDELEQADDDLSEAVETAADDAEEAVEELAADLDAADDEFNDMLDISDDDGDTFAIDDTEEDTMDEEIDLGLEDLLEEGDAIDTKLDLAKAYIDMGDAEGAKNLLDEIINEGTDDQVEAAKKLLDDM
ncbi:FimV/HubP family polar landmark protein [Marinicella meishanensis]|uniref:FimV/HubP family polar landmark protein n=1 Tax=Marinicella meishanensis TaxID=2873263 RepID=UPI001CBAC8CD|nr:FimV/HubP family polar landmark protein [Marinicella sp. NBU2979]